jgi:hypothetical protein
MPNDHWKIAKRAITLKTASRCHTRAGSSTALLCAREHKGIAMSKNFVFCAADTWNGIGHDNIRHVSGKIPKGGKSHPSVQECLEDNLDYFPGESIRVPD